MKSSKELRAIELTPEQEKIRNQFVFNALATVVEINQGAKRDHTPTYDLIELMNIGTDYTLDPEGYLKR